MAVEDGRSFHHEYYATKVKNDRMKGLLLDYKNDLKRLMNIEVKHDLLQEKLDDILADKIEVKKAEMITEEKSRASLPGHFDEASTLFI